MDETDIKYCNAEKWESMSHDQKQMWKDYKKALKDFPSHCDPFNPVWPVKPEK